MNKNLLYRSIPKVDVLLENQAIQEMIERYSRDSVMEAIRAEMDNLRAFIGGCDEEDKAQEQRCRREDAYSEYEESNQWHRYDPAHQSGTCTDQPGTYEESI